jgi:hypothetical protein
MAGQTPQLEWLCPPVPEKRLPSHLASFLEGLGLAYSRLDLPRTMAGWYAVR